MGKINEVVDRYLTEGFKKFDDVRIKSKNKSGMIYQIKGKQVFIKTVSGLVKTTTDDLETI